MTKDQSDKWVRMNTEMKRQAARIAGGGGSRHASRRKRGELKRTRGKKSSREKIRKDGEKEEEKENEGRGEGTGEENQP